MFKTLIKEESGFNRVLGKLIDMIWLNLLTAFCCMPIVTIGASITAMYSILMKSVKDEEGYITKPFFKAFKENFKKSTKVWLLVLLSLIICVMDIKIINKVGNAEVLLIFVGIFTIVTLVGAVYVFPLIARYENTIKNTIKNAYIYVIAHLPETIKLIIIQILPMFFAYECGGVVAYMLFIGFAIPGYMSAKKMVKIFEKYDNVEE